MKKLFFLEKKRPCEGADSPRPYLSGKSYFSQKNTPSSVQTALALTFDEKNSPATVPTARKKNAMGPGQGGFKATRVQGTAVSRPKIIKIQITTHIFRLKH